MLYAFVSGTAMDINKIEAFSSVLWEFDLSTEQEMVLMSAISIFKINYLVTHIRV
jgi:hypothetical protein